MLLNVHAHGAFIFMSINSKLVNAKDCNSGILLLNSKTHFSTVRSVVRQYLFPLQNGEGFVLVCFLETGFQCRRLYNWDSNQ